MIRFINDFNKKNITNLINRKNGTLKKYHESFDYVFDRLPNNSLGDLNKAKWYETKSYNYARVDTENISLIIREYRYHFIIYIRNIDQSKIYKDRTYDIIEYVVGERDDHDDDIFKELNKSLPDIIELVRKGQIHTIWNDLCINTETNVKQKVILDHEDVNNLELYVFALEELFQLHFQMFAENEVVERIESFNTGDSFHDGTITKVSKLNKKDNKDIYYHGIGIAFHDKNGRDKFEDVYSLARWYYDDLFGQETKVYHRRFDITYNGNTYMISNVDSFFGCCYYHEIDNNIVFSSSDDIEVVKELLKVNFLDSNIVKIHEKVKAVK